MAKVGLTLRDYKKLWRKHGGDQHGPRVETMTIPESNFEAFIRDAVATAIATKEQKL